MTKLILVLALVYLIVSRLSTWPRKINQESSSAKVQQDRNKSAGEYVDYEEVE